MTAVEKKKSNNDNKNNHRNDEKIKRKRKKIGNLSVENKRGSQVHKGHQRQTKEKSRNRPSMCVVVQMEKDQKNDRKRKKKSNRELKGGKSKSQINEAVCRWELRVLLSLVTKCLKYFCDF